MKGFTAAQGKLVQTTLLNNYSKMVRIPTGGLLNV